MKRSLAAVLLCAYALCYVNTVFAGVYINEIAWMGTKESSTNEWIELANDGGSAVDLSGWHLTAADGSPNFALAKSISAHGYYLIERTDDTTLPDIEADIIASFGKGLANAGETLQLTDASATVIDMVEGGTNWSNVGGDNTTKETAQRLFAPAGTRDSWTTGTPTPRAQNVSTKAAIAVAQTNSVMKLPATSSGDIITRPRSAPATTMAKVPPPSSAQIDSEHATTTHQDAATVLWERKTEGEGGVLHANALRWFSVLVGMLGVVLVGLIVSRRTNTEASPADAYTIVEVFEEGEEE